MKAQLLSLERIFSLIRLATKKLQERTDFGLEVWNSALESTLIELESLASDSRLSASMRPIAKRIRLEILAR